LDLAHLLKPGTMLILIQIVTPQKSKSIGTTQVDKAIVVIVTEINQVKAIAIKVCLFQTTLQAAIAVQIEMDTEMAV